MQSQTALENLKPQKDIPELIKYFPGVQFGSNDFFSVCNISSSSMWLFDLCVQPGDFDGVRHFTVHIKSPDLLKLLRSLHFPRSSEMRILNCLPTEGSGVGDIDPGDDTTVKQQVEQNPQHLHDSETVEETVEQQVEESHGNSSNMISNLPAELKAAEEVNALNVGASADMESREAVDGLLDLNSQVVFVSEKKKAALQKVLIFSKSVYRESHMGKKFIPAKAKSKLQKKWAPAKQRQRSNQKSVKEMLFSILGSPLATGRTIPSEIKKKFLHTFKEINSHLSAKEQSVVKMVEEELKQGVSETKRQNTA